MSGEGLTAEESRSVADALWAVDWVSATDGYLECPGCAKHNNKDGARDCRIMLEGGKPPTVHCLHTSCIGEITDANFRLRSALGKAESAKRKDGTPWRPSKDWRPTCTRMPEEPPSYDAEKLTRFAGDYAGIVDFAWLANRSVIDPTTATSEDFLNALYHRDRGEKVVIFTNEYSQGECLWPTDAKVPDRGREGVWFLAQPVTGEYHPNPRSKPPGQPSRRIGECVREWRFLLLESDDAPAELWLGAVVQLPLRIAAIYTSGSRSVHVLVQVDAPVQSVWEKEKAELLRGVITLGACRGSLSGVRLTRLPGCLRYGKTVVAKDEEGNAILNEKGKPKRVYVKYETPGHQKLLYLNPDPAIRPLAAVIPRRDVVADVLAQGRALSGRVRSAELDELKAFCRRASRLAQVSRQCAVAAEDVRMVIKARASK